MVQAARSGKQNIAEGCSASTTSTETEIKLINVARASLQELLLDYEDYLRVRNLQQWPETDERFIRTRKICSAHNDSAYYREAIESRSDETIANIAIILIKQADYLLRRYFNRIQRDFLHNGGIREEMSRARHNFIKQNK
jgi:four helix bundle suffix protein